MTPWARQGLERPPIGAWLGVCFYLREGFGRISYYWANVREKKQAEFLVKDLFPWKLIEEIGVMDETIQAQVESILAQFPHLPHPPVRVRRSWYY